MPDSENRHESLKDQDLGLGSYVIQQSRRRFLNPDGSFNVERKGLHFLPAISPYYSLLTMSWLFFILLMLSSFILINTGFALLYLACGPHALQGIEATTLPGRFLETFFFSVQTFSTIGYGAIVPTSLNANLIMTLEAAVNLVIVALMTGLTFARFSRPTSGISYSKQAIVAPYQGYKALMFRIVNERKSQIIEISAKVVLSYYVMDNQKRSRRFYPLSLEREQVSFFPLAWTIVHPITETSPMYGMSQTEFQNADAEVLVLLSGMDETFSQIVHSRSSYKGEEIIWNVKFANLYNPPTADGKLSINVAKLSEIESL